MTANISFNSNNYNAQSPEMQQRLQSEANFGAIDRDKLKQDTAEFSEKAQQKVQENLDDNGYVKAAKKVVPDNVKKFLKSLFMVTATTVGLAVLGNKVLLKTTDAGLKVDEFLLKQDWYNSLSKTLKKGKDNFVAFLRKSETLDDIFDTFKNRRAMQKSDFTRGYGKGFLSIFSLTPPDVLKKSLAKQGSKDDQIKILKTLVGDKADDIHTMLFAKNGVENRKICAAITDAIDANFGCGGDKNKILDVFKKMKAGGKCADKAGNLVDFAGFTNITMKENAKGIAKLNPFNIIGDWWPANFIRKITPKKWHSGLTGNLGDALIKYNVVNGSMAQTGLGKLVQKSIIVPTESISNFVNDKSGLGVFLCLFTMLPLFNNVQDAPKNQKVATVADDFVGTIGSIAISTPLAFGATYGLATLANLKGNTVLSKILKVPGRFFNAGLDRYAKDGVTKIAGSKNIIPRFGGGAMRFALVMLVFSRIFSKPIYAAIHKVFGKPYNKEEVAAQKAAEEQKNQIIPELGITQGEFIEKVQNNPKAIEELQNNPELVQKMQQNPKLLLDYLDGKDVNNANVQNSAQYNPQQGLSAANAALLNKGQMTASNANTLQDVNNNVQNTQTQNGQVQNEASTVASGEGLDTATYIPSSAFVAKNSNYTDEQTKEINDALAKADKALARAEKFM